MSKLRQISLGTFSVQEIRLKPNDQPDVIVLQDADVTNAIRTFDFADGMLGLANAQLQDIPVALILEFGDPTDE